jgi:hypothetical protein
MGNVIQRDSANLLRIRNWKSAARNKGEWRKKVGGPWPENGPKGHISRRRVYLPECL